MVGEIRLSRKNHESHGRTIRKPTCPWKSWWVTIDLFAKFYTLLLIRRMKELLAAQLNIQDTGFESVTELKIAVEHLKDDNLRLMRKIKDLEEEVWYSQHIWNLINLENIVWKRATIGRRIRCQSLWTSEIRAFSFIFSFFIDLTSFFNNVIYLQSMGG